MKVPILIPNIFDHPFTYDSNSLNLDKGNYVIVPFGSTKITGIVWDKFEKAEKKFLIKKIEKKLDVPKMQGSMIDFLNWFSIYNIVPMGMCIRLTLLSKGAVENIPENSFNQYQKLNRNLKYKLNSEQEKCLSEIKKKENKFNVHVLDGVTGSGKTLVYFNRLREIINRGYQALIMLPEIGLTTQFKKRFIDFFGFEPAVWHSATSKKNKKIIWRGIVEKKIRVVVGARSSLFLPFAKLGIIIVDEEHDASYKQDEGIIYNARDMAVSRGSFEKIPVLLITSIPSVETFNNIINKKYSISKLKKRYQDASMPNFEIINLNNKRISNKSWLANETIKKVNYHLQKGDQVLFFLNRRGFAPFVICKKCYTKFLCPNCSVNLNYHKSKNFLLCHYCGYKTKLNKICKDNKPCEFIMCGPGVERIAEELEQRYPDKKIRIFSSDTLNKKKSSEDLIEKIENKKIDILVGTQLISKGFHFSKLNCIVVVDADFSSHGYDLRSAEKNIQLYHQLSGRAGREGLSSTIYFQTYTPNDETLLNISKKDPHKFLLNEIELRKLNKLPPFCRFISVIISGKKEKQAINEAIKVKNQITKDIKEEMLGPVNAPIFKLNQKYRCRLLLRSKKNILIQKKLAKTLKKIKITSGIKLTVDVDPITFN
ncbi:MAG: primosomal protein N' [Alphaproteobacteria bacterium]|jgi:primosomal protein N' (replication factor Y)|nr:primosomal protein N' [Alphaproteobacteria bacterium]|tara:strand:+ start:14573 stop:16531 length:1959 start_codon:yes stop_codon:yes gene_type:complete